MKEEKYNYSRVILDKIRFNLKQEVPENILLHTEIKQIQDHLTRSIIYFIKSDVAGQQKLEEYKIKVPKNWWQHLLSNFKSKYKTKEISVKIDHKVLFPDIELLNEQNVIYKDVVVSEPLKM